MIRASILALTCIALAGCETFAPPTRSIAIANETSATIHDARVRYPGERQPHAEHIEPHALYVMVGVKAPLPNTANVRWKSESGESHDWLAKVKPALPPDFHEGTIVFTINRDNSVTVVANKWQGQDLSKNFLDLTTQPSR